jgi:hypothetical protein
VGTSQLASNAVTGTQIDPTSSITAANFTYAAAKTVHVSVHSYSFVPQNSSVTWDGNSLLTSNAFRAMTGGSPLVAAALVTVPDGAIITRLQATLLDISTTAHITIYLRRFETNGYGSTIAQVGTTDAETTGQVTRSVTFSHPVSNTNNASYLLVWEQTVAGTASSGPGLYNAGIDYTYTNP